MCPQDWMSRQQVRGRKVTEDFPTSWVHKRAIWGAHFVFGCRLLCIWRSDSSEACFLYWSSFWHGWKDSPDVNGRNSRAGVKNGSCHLRSQNCDTSVRGFGFCWRQAFNALARSGSVVLLGSNTLWDRNCNFERRVFAETTIRIDTIWSGRICGIVVE